MGVRRRLLERLQQPVGRGVAHRLDPLDHEDPPGRLERGPRGGGDDRLVDVGDEHLGGAARRHPAEVGVRPAVRPLGGARRILAPSASSAAAKARAAVRLPSRRAAEQVGVRRPPGRGERRDQHRPSVGVVLEPGEPAHPAEVMGYRPGDAARAPDHHRRHRRDGETAPRRAPGRARRAGRRGRAPARAGRGGRLRAGARARQGPERPALRPRRGAALRRRPGPARHRAADPAARGRDLGAARPLRRLLARLPGGRARARHRGRPRDQPLRHDGARGRPDPAPATEEVDGGLGVDGDADL